MEACEQTAQQDAFSAGCVSSGEALAILGVKPQTLYSYVSRGLIRRMSPNGKTIFYSREDIHRLKARSLARSGHGAVAGSAMHWGEPILATGITDITPEGPRYRRHLALDLVRDDYPFEALAEYLWSGTEPARSTRWPVDMTVMRIVPQLEEMVDRYPGMHTRQLLMEVVLLLSVAQRDNGEMLPAAFSPATARALIQAMCGAFGLLGPDKRYVAPVPGESIACYIARAFGISGSRSQLRALNAALVLLADHEFTPATFAARIAASAGVDLYSCIGAALQVHFGSALGLRCDCIEAALQKMDASPAPVACNTAPLPEAVSSIAFNHPLYAHGDPRAKKILSLALALKQHPEVTRATLRAIMGIDDQRWTVSLDASLVVLCRALGIGKPVTGGLLAVSRSAGWIAHVIEQYQQEFMIRPRGKFIGALPDMDASLP